MPEKRRPQKSEEADADIEFRFRTILGVSPRTYVPALYGLAAVAILFFLLVYPGIRNNGTVVTFTTTPPGASVLIDGVRIGATPLSAFVEKGRRTMVVRKPFFDEITVELDVEGRVIGSLILPRRVAVQERLVSADPAELLADASTRFASWSLVGRPSAQYQFPLVAAPAVEDVLLSGAGVSKEDLTAFVMSQAASARSDMQLRDVVRAHVIASASGAPMGARSLVAALRGLAEAAEARPASPFWLAGAASQMLGIGEYTESPYFQKRLSEYTTELITEALRADPSAGPIAPEIITVEGIDFARVPAGNFVLGGIDDAGIDPFAVPVVREIGAFAMMRTEVTVELYRQFVAANPEYSPERRADLVAEGTASGDYLAPFGRREYLAEADAEEPVVAISYAAAEAFAAWLDFRIDGFSARLPTEAEWEWAAFLNAEDPRGAFLYSEGIDSPAGPRPVTASPPGRLGIADLHGNVWEWCDDWHRPAAYPFADTRGTAPTYPAAMRVVRGGSWANPSDEVGIRSRGAQDPVWSTPYLGFRVILVADDGR